MRFYCNIDQLEVSKFQWFTFLMLLSYYRLQEVNWILNKRRPRLNVACKQAHIWEHTRERQRANLSFGRSLVTRREESEPALISVKFSFLLRLSEVKYHWSKSGKGDKTVNLLCFTRSD